MALPQEVEELPVYRTARHAPIARRRVRAVEPPGIPLVASLFAHVVIQALLVIFFTPVPDAGTVVILFCVSQAVYAVPLVVIAAVAGRHARVAVATAVGLLAVATLFVLNFGLPVQMMPGF